MQQQLEMGNQRNTGIVQAYLLPGLIVVEETGQRGQED
jgi:hypothetical protein